jgi:hypothetical protein
MTPPKCCRRWSLVSHSTRGQYQYEVKGVQLPVVVVNFATVLASDPWPGPGCGPQRLAAACPRMGGGCAAAGRGGATVCKTPWLTFVIPHCHGDHAPDGRRAPQQLLHPAPERCDLKNDASLAPLAATQNEELKAKQYIKAFPSMQAASFFGFGLDTYGAWGTRRYARGRVCGADCGLQVGASGGPWRTPDVEWRGDGGTGDDQTPASRVCGDGAGGRTGQVHPPDARQVRRGGRTRRVAAGHWHDARAVLAAAIGGLTAGAAGGLAGSAGGAEQAGT